MSSRTRKKMDYPLRTTSSFVHLLLSLPGLLVGCAGLGAAQSLESAEGQSTFQRDRQAILAMAGEYEVTFRFTETVPLREGYETHKPFDAQATEFVEVIEDEGDRIVLQHILVMGEDRKLVNKHWAQEWTYEDSLIYEFKGNNTWKPLRLSPKETEGTWTQRVTQVDDSPRYEAVGKWVHQENVSYWTSGETWRPIPRRESSRRDEYDVLVSNNRLTITPGGWTHEADSYKLVLGDVDEPILTREAGLNTYKAVEDVDFSAGREYWEETHRFWRDVRRAWDNILGKKKQIQLRDEIDGQPLWQAMFEMARQVREDSTYQRSAWQSRIEQTLSRYLGFETSSDQ